jgi:mycothiol synthase
MRRSNIDELPALEVPDGLALRTFQTGDESGWAVIMTGSIDPPGASSVWDEESVRNHEYIGTATAKRARGEAAAGYVHMVAVAQTHRGHRFGRLPSLAVLHRFREWGCQSAVLDTDDDRLAAIRTYLDLGFAPDFTKAGHRERWDRILEAMTS